MLSHPIESDGVSAQFFQHLAKENKKDMQSCRVQCPLTVLFEQGFAKAAYATEFSRPGEPVGELKRKPGKEIDLNELFQQLTRNTVEGDIVAVLLHASPRVSEMNHVRFMDKADLRSFLFQEIEKPRSLLQRFVKPKGVSNTLIHAVWSPLMVLAEGRRNAHSLKDRHLAPSVRGTTFESAGANTTEVVVAQAVVKDITKVCKSIADHFEKSDRLTLNRLAAFFKVDDKNQLQLLFSTSIRVQDSATGRNSAPVSLAIAVKPQLKASAVASAVLDEDAFLNETDSKERGLRMSIPSMPDTSSLLLKGLHSSAARSGRNGSPGMTSPSTSPRMMSPRLHASTPQPRRAASRSTALNVTSPQPNRSQSRQAGSPSAQRSMQPAPSPSSLHHQGASPSRSTVPRGERQVALTPGAVLPQPRALLKYQHVLPNSEQNVVTATKRVEQGRTEHEMKLEWETFLQQQQRELAVIRKAEEDREAESLVRGAASMAPGGRTTSGRPAKDLVAPPVRAAATFAGQHRVAFSRSSDGEGSPSAGGGGLNASVTNATSTGPDRNDKASFMAHWRSSHPPDNTGADTAGASHDASADFEPEQQAVLPELADSHANKRITIQLPPNSKLPRSVLLPPSFAAGSPTKAVQNRRAPRQSRGSASPLGTRAKAVPEAISTGTRRGDTSPKTTPQTPASPARGQQSASVTPRAAAGRQPHSHASSSQASPSPAVLGKPAIKDPNATRPTTSTDAASAPVARVMVSIPGELEPTSTATPMHSSNLQSIPAAPESSKSRIEPVLTMSPQRAAAQRGVTPADMLLRYRSKTVRSGGAGDASLATAASDADDVAAEGLDDESRAEVRRRAAVDCATLRQYVADLHYALYCFFLQSTKTDAYIEVPQALRCCVTPQVLKTLLHKLHGNVVKREEYLRSITTPGVSLLITRDDLLSRLNAGALAEYPVPEVATEEDLGHGSTVFVVPRFEGRFLVLRGEDSAADGDSAIDGYCEEPDGVVYDAAHRHHLYAVVTEKEGAKELAERLKRAEDQAREQRDLEDDSSYEPSTRSPAVGASTSQTPRLTPRGLSSFDAHDSPQGSPTIPAVTRSAETFCHRCQTCTMCCVCALLGRNPILQAPAVA